MFLVLFLASPTQRRSPWVSFSVTVLFFRVCRLFLLMCLAIVGCLFFGSWYYCMRRRIQRMIPSNRGSVNSSRDVSFRCRQLQPLPIQTRASRPRWTPVSRPLPARTPISRPSHATSTYRTAPLGAPVPQLPQPVEHIPPNSEYQENTLNEPPPAYVFPPVYKS